MNHTINYKGLTQIFKSCAPQINQLGTEFASDQVQVNRCLNLRTFDMKEYTDLLNNNGLADHYGNLMIAGIAFGLFVSSHDQLTKLLSDDALDNQRYLELIAFLLKNDPDKIQIRFSRKDISGKGATLLYNPEDPKIIKEILKILQTHYLNMPGSLFKGLDLTPRNLSLKRVRSHLKQFKVTAAKGRTKKRSDLQKFVRELHLFLEEETPVRAEEGVMVSDQQCRFIFDFLSVFGYIAYKQDDTDYIRSLLHLTSNDKSYLRTSDI